MLSVIPIQHMDKWLPETSTDWLVVKHESAREAQRPTDGILITYKKEMDRWKYPFRLAHLFLTVISPV